MLVVARDAVRNQVLWLSAIDADGGIFEKDDKNKGRRRMARMLIEM